MFRGMPAVQYSRGMLGNTMVRFAIDDSPTEVGTSAAPPSRTVGTMTDYREMETQTDAWTPQFVVRPGSAPEVVRCLPACPLTACLPLDCLPAP